MVRQQDPQSALLRRERDRALRVMFVASEIYPLAKTGGLADVCASLPQALTHLGADVRLLMPGYGEALERVLAPQTVADLGEVLPGAPVRLLFGWMPDTAIPVWLIDCPPLFQRPGSLYQDPEGRDWTDNALRFAVLGHVAARLALGQVVPDWQPDIVHAHDWHAGLLPLLLRQAGHRRPRSVFTTHNSAFQGNFPLEHAARLGLPENVLTTDGIEFYGQLSFLKAGICYADKVTTVSPTYAREIRTPAFGCGMERVFESRRDDLLGIMNGIDANIWNPAADPYLTQCYSPEKPAGKRFCKTALQRQLGLSMDGTAPLVAFVGRLTQQKMADVVLEQLPAMLQLHPRLQFTLHGCGDRALEQGFTQLGQHYPGRTAIRIGYAEAHAHQVLAGADILLHGSRFEPCGLTQMYAMRYGAIPIVSRVGGLADSVVDAGSASRHADGPIGFVFDELTGEAMTSTLNRCLEMYESSPRTWAMLRRLAMGNDFGWARSAREYARLYAELVPEHALSLQTAEHTVLQPMHERRVVAPIRPFAAIAGVRLDGDSAPWWSSAYAQ